MSIRLLFISSIILGLTSCIEIEEPSDIPFIDYQYHVAEYCEDQLGNENKCITLFFKLKDGDGNIGLAEEDTLPPFTGIYSHNFYFDVFVPSGDEFVPWEDLAINYFNIPFIEPAGQNKILIADVAIEIFFQTFTFDYDTLLISFYVYDRALNQSNIEMTDTIIFE